MALQVGLFETPHSYDCWVRISNSSGKLQSDAMPDARGIAIKLLAPRSRAEAGETSGQDFVLLDTPVMPLGTVAMFRDAVYYTIESTPVLLAAKFAITGHAGALIGLLGLRNTPSSPLDVRYWSTTPYRFGEDHVVKYSLIPTSVYTSPKPHDPGDDPTWAKRCRCTWTATTRVSTSACSCGAAACPWKMRRALGRAPSRRSGR